MDMKITVHDIGDYLLRDYLLETPIGWIAIDTGYAGNQARYFKRLHRLVSPEQIRFVFLTHAHDDHAGFLAPLLQASGAQLVCHANALPRLASGENAVPPGAGFSSRAGQLFGLVKKSHAFPPFAPDARALILKSETDQPFLALGLPLRVVFLPGHTDDSIALFNEETRDLFCGDAAMNAVISTARHTIWIDDPAAFGRSWDKMLTLDPQTIIPSHGNPFSPDDLIRFRHFFDGKQTLRPNR